MSAPAAEQARARRALQHYSQSYMCWGFAEFPPDGVVNSDTAAAMTAAVGVHLVRFSAVQCGSSAIRTFPGRRTNHQLDTFRQDEDTGFGDVQDRTRPI